jgi:CRISPR/Cas system CSM-associated protein Csm3 (group 7 of RAMP superfamily)
MTTVTEQIKLDYRLIFDAPFHFGTGLRRGLIHRTVAKDHGEYLIVPGTTIKGVVRERCEQLGDIFDLHVVEPHDTQDTETRIHEARLDDPDIVTRIFGSRFLAGPLFFDDAHLADFSTDRDEAASPSSKMAIDRSYFDGVTFDEEEKKKVPEPGKYKLRQVETRTQVSLSRLTRTAKAGHLYTSEYGIRQLCFDGRIYGYLKGLNEGLDHGTYALLLLLAGLLSVDRIGGMKSTGAGEVGIQVTQLQINGQSMPVKTILAQLEYLELYDELVRGENS